MHPALVKGAVAVVTGAASGIGLAAARHLAGLGLRVYLADRDGEALERARQALVAEGASAADVVAVATDVSERRALTALADRVEAAFGAVNVLMNNAGIGPEARSSTPRGRGTAYSASTWAGSFAAARFLRRA